LERHQIYWGRAWWIYNCSTKRERDRQLVHRCYNQWKRAFNKYSFRFLR